MPVKLTIMIQELIKLVHQKHVPSAPILAKSVILLLQHVQNVILPSVLLVEVVFKQHVLVRMVILIPELMLVVQPKLVQSVLILAINVRVRPLLAQNVMML